MCWAESEKGVRGSGSTRTHIIPGIITCNRRRRHSIFVLDEKVVKRLVAMLEKRNRAPSNTMRCDGTKGKQEDTEKRARRRNEMKR